MVSRVETRVGDLGDNALLADGARRFSREDDRFPDMRFPVRCCERSREDVKRSSEPSAATFAGKRSDLGG